ncbi:MAG: hypothetical protein FWH22_06860 [Fibromonadales bacterium]|nr:hypothetical protein [Fibromonadales bacterium]
MQKKVIVFAIMAICAFFFTSCASVIKALNEVAQEQEQEQEQPSPKPQPQGEDEGSKKQRKTSN